MRCQRVCAPFVVGRRVEGCCAAAAGRECMGGRCISNQKNTCLLGSILSWCKFILKEMLRAFGRNHCDALARASCLLLLLLLCLSVASARNSSGKGMNHNNRRYSSYAGDREFRQRKIDCASSQCAGKVGAEESNCTYKCMSPSCFEEIYGHDEIEEGEIDSSRSRLFSTCFKRVVKEEELAKSAAPRVEVASQLASHA